MRLKLVILVSVTGALAGCDLYSQLDVFVACTERLESVSPSAKGLFSKDFPEIDGFGQPDAGGEFKFDVSATNSSKAWTCAGNSKSRRIREVSYDGVVEKPSNAEYWSY